MFGAFGLFNDIELEKDLRNLADMIKDNREQKKIINLFIQSTKYEPKLCDCNLNEIEKLKCPNCHGYGYVLVPKKEDDKND